MLRAEPVISEFLAANVTGAEVGTGGLREDWIEILIREPAPVIGRLALDRAAPANTGQVDLPLRGDSPKGYLVVWASNKNRDAGQLHTNFKLDATGEYLGLIRPDGSAAHEFSPTYPPQRRTSPTAPPSPNPRLNWSAGALPPRCGCPPTTWTPPPG